MIPELEIIPEVKTNAKRLDAKDVTVERLNSLRESVIDFCWRSKSLCQPMSTWAYVSKILRGQEDAEIWWALDGDRVDGFLISRVAQDFDGQWTVYVLFGWSNSLNGKDYFKTVIEDYLKKGAARIQFNTRRHARVFQRWAGTDFKQVATTFELRR
jgi:hypothetical protein